MIDPHRDDNDDARRGGEAQMCQPNASAFRFSFDTSAVGHRACPGQVIVTMDQERHVVVAYDENVDGGVFWTRREGDGVHDVVPETQVAYVCF